MTATRSRTPWYARALRVALTLVVGGTVFAPFAVAQQGAPPLCGTDRGGWESIDVPFTEGPDAIKSWSISSTTTLMLATNGRVVMRSVDRGCSWTEAWRLDTVPAPGTTVTATESVIEEVHVSESPLAVNTVFVTVDQLRPVSRPRVFVSTDGAQSFEPSERGLETAVGRPEDIATAESNPGRVYLLTDATGIQRSLLPDGLPPELEGAKGIAQVLYESVDGGETWSPAAPVYPGDPWNGIEVDPRDADVVWLYGDKGLGRAFDLDVAPAPTDPARPAPISAMDVWHLAGQQARVIATTANDARVYRSADGGSVFAVDSIPGIAQSVVAMSPIQEVYATSTGVWLVTAGARPFNMSPDDRRPVIDLYLTDGAGTEVWGRSETTIERKVFRGPRRETFDLCKEAAKAGVNVPGCPHTEQDFEVPCVEVDDPGEPALQPPRVDLTLKPGESRTVSFDFDVPAKGQPLDVFFLIDVSGSMQDAIDGTARAMNEIVTRLTNGGHDVWFGVGEYRSYNQPPAYRRVLDVTNDCGAVEEALESLIAYGGGEETQLEALYQVARGETRPGLGAVVPPGQNATFRADATRIIIHTTDETITEGPPNPSMDEVEEALDSADIQQVGVAIEDGFTTSGDNPLQDKPPPSEGLKEIAERTEAWAPKRGVDCDGDGHVDIPWHEPVVCKISPLRARDASLMAPAIINMLKSQLDTPEVCWEVPVGAAVVEEVSDTGCRPAEGTEMGFDVTFSCPQLHARKRFELEVGATVTGLEGGLQEETSPVSVLCKVPAKPVPKDPPLVPFVALPVAFIPPPPIPPEIPPVPNPNPNPQPNPQGQAQAQAQAAMAHQEQQQPQLAYVYAQHQHAAAVAQESAGGKESEYAMSSYSKDSDGVPPEAIFMIGAMTMSAAFGCVTLAREKVRVQHVRR
ncbi:MAG TPA: vWA domain-containing protein [Actinomycetota bacterium]|nr:vWA domain-containing protein [Actinomycetota bacterium]